MVSETFPRLAHIPTASIRSVGWAREALVHFPGKLARVRHNCSRFSPALAAIVLLGNGASRFRYLVLGRKGFASLWKRCHFNN